MLEVYSVSGWDASGKNFEEAASEQEAGGEIL